jgi:hypothetical protein
LKITDNLGKGLNSTIAAPGQNFRQVSLDKPPVNEVYVYIVFPYGIFHKDVAEDGVERTTSK